ncbi:Uncharacterised protein [Pseudomonas aeruginosa]|nr:Uncharacterised protein [Pseudomonas aeruginosa]
MPFWMASALQAQGLQALLEAFRLLVGDGQLADHGVGRRRGHFRGRAKAQERRAERGGVLETHAHRGGDTRGALEDIDDVATLRLGVVVQVVDRVAKLAHVLDGQLVEVGDARKVLADLVRRQFEGRGCVRRGFGEDQQVVLALDAHARAAFDEGCDLGGGHGNALGHGLDSVAHVVVGRCELAVVVARAVYLLCHAQHRIFEVDVAVGGAEYRRPHGGTCRGCAGTIGGHAPGEALGLLEGLLGGGYAPLLRAQAPEPAFLVADCLVGLCDALAQLAFALAEVGGADTGLAELAH